MVKGRLELYVVKLCRWLINSCFQPHQAYIDAKKSHQVDNGQFTSHLEPMLKQILYNDE